MDLQPFGGDQVPVPSGDVGLGSQTVPKDQSPSHHALLDSAGGHGRYRMPLCEWRPWWGWSQGPGGKESPRCPALRRVWICLSLGNTLKARAWGAPGSWLAVISGKAKGAGLWERAGEQPGGQVFDAPERRQLHPLLPPGHGAAQAQGPQQ